MSRKNNSIAVIVLSQKQKTLSISRLLFLVLLPARTQGNNFRWRHIRPVRRKGFWVGAGLSNHADVTQLPLYFLVSPAPESNKVCLNLKGKVNINTVFCFSVYLFVLYTILFGNYLKFVWECMLETNASCLPVCVTNLLLLISLIYRR